MSIPLTKGWKLYSVNDWGFDLNTFGDSNNGVFSFIANVKPIEPFDVKDLLKEYNRLILSTKDNVTYNICGQEFFIHTLAIPGHFHYLSVRLVSNASMDYQDAKDMMYKLSSSSETGYNPYGTVTIHSFDDCRPWYKRIFDWFL